MNWSESRLHDYIIELRAGADEGGCVVGEPGSDAAVLATGLKRPVLCVDQLVEGRHFMAEASPEDVGRKAAGRALSDLAATAATPRALLLTLRADDGLTSGETASEEWLRAVLRGVWASGHAYGAPLVGGDIAAGDGPTSLAVTALGEFEFAGVPPGREHARAGDVVLLTGALGGSILGRHLCIHPRLEEGRWLYARGARAMMDVSDGLALDLTRVARRSGVDIQLELDQVPVHADAHRLAKSDQVSALDHALSDGEDHELIAFAGEADALALLTEGCPLMPELRRIGRVVERLSGPERESGQELWVRSGSKASWSPFKGRGGYVHGTRLGG
ncbi:MAG: thiamine-monophosphate kinase [Planctomycetota bacterium]|jgi:thiamine-monophosphate kinase